MASAGTLVGTLTTTDPDLGDTHQYELLDSADGRFALDGDRLRVADGSRLNYEVNARHQIRIKATDSTGLSIERGLTIQIGNVNEAPVNLQFVREDAPPIAFYAIGDFPGGQVASIAMAVTDNGVVFGSGSSAGGQSGTETGLRWTVANGLERLDLASVRAVSANGSVIVGETKYDNAGISDEQGIRVLGNGPGSALGVSANGGVVVGSLNQQAFRWTARTGETLLPRSSSRVTTSDAMGISADGSTIVGREYESADSRAVMWTPTGVVILGDLPGGDVYAAASDVSADGSVVVGRASPSQGQEAFRWTAATGMVGLGTFPGGNYYSFAAAVSDDGQIVVGSGSASPSTSDAFIWDAEYGMRSLTQVLTSSGVSLQGLQLISAGGISPDGQLIVGWAMRANYNIEAWMAVLPRSIDPTIAENSPAGTAVARLSSSDPDHGDTTTYVLLNSAGGRFRIEGDHLVVADSTLLDYETAGSHTIRIRATDGGLSLDRDFVVTLSDVNEPPTDIAISHSSLPENSPAGFVLGTLSAVDQDQAAGLAFSLAADSAQFELVGNAVVVKSHAVLDFEASPTINLRVRATDTQGLWFEKDLSVDLEDQTEIVSSVVGPNGHRYDLVAAAHAWSDARTLAENSELPIGFTRAHLATIGDSAEDAFLQNAFDLPADQALWLGFTDEAEQGIWRSVDGSSGQWLDERLHPGALQTAFVQWSDSQPLARATITKVSRGINPGGEFYSQVLGLFEHSATYEPPPTSPQAGSGASQTSTVNALGPVLITGGGSNGWGSWGNSSSFLYATLVVYSPTDIKLAGNLAGSPNQFGSARVVLSGSEQIYSRSSLESEFNQATVDYQGVLAPGTYQLSVDSSGGSSGFAGSGGAHWSFRFEQDAAQAAQLVGGVAGWRSASTWSTAAYYLVEYEPSNVPPPDFSLSNTTVSENIALGRVVGELTSSGSFANPVNYTLLDDAGGRFYLGAEALRVAANLDFETAQSHTVRLRATDATGQQVDKEFVISVENRNEAPLITLPGSQFAQPGVLTSFQDVTLVDPDLVAGSAALLRLSLGAEQGQFHFESLAGLEVVEGANDSRSLSLEGTLDSLQAALQIAGYRADAGFSGLAALEFTLDDQGNTGEGLALASAQTLNLQINRPPVANSNTYLTEPGQTLRGGTVLANDRDDDGDPLTARLVALPAHGSLEFNADGTFTYRSNPGFFGRDSFRYRAIDAYFESEPVEVTIETVPIPGDADLDGDVDLSDFGILKAHFGLQATPAQGDFNGDGHVDLTDFALLKAVFGTVNRD